MFGSDLSRSFVFDKLSAEFCHMKVKSSAEETAKIHFLKFSIQYLIRAGGWMKFLKINKRPPPLVLGTRVIV